MEQEMELIKDPQIIAAIIAAAGTIIAAVIAALVAIRIEKKIIPQKIETFSDKNHDVMKIIDRAKYSIYIVAQIGDIFWDSYQENIEKLMAKNRDLEIRCLILNKEKYKELQEYTHEDAKAKYKGLHGDALEPTIEKYVDPYKTTLDKLKKLQITSDKRFVLKEFNQIMTVSYIGVDIDIVNAKGKWLPSSAIQIMLYQYDLPACDSLLFTINPTFGKKKYEKTVNSIVEMWNKADPIF